MLAPVVITTELASADIQSRQPGDLVVRNPLKVDGAKLKAFLFRVLVIAEQPNNLEREISLL